MLSRRRVGGMSKLVRRPWGMPGWLYWTLVVVVAFLVTPIPEIGPGLTLLLVAVSIYVWTRKPKQYAPSAITRYERLAMPYEQEVVGESHYQREISGFVSRNGRKVAVTLTHEPWNRHSPRRQAVRVDLINGEDIVTCGYLPEAVAGSWLPVILRAARNGVRLWCDADVRGGWQSAPNYGVWLVPERVVKRAPRQKSNVRFEPADDVREFWSGQDPQSG